MMSRNISETIYTFKSLIDDLSQHKSFRSMLNRHERDTLKEISLAMQSYLGPDSSIQNLNEFLDRCENKNMVIKKLNDEDLSELAAIANKLAALKFTMPER